ncbi:hypothetical protein [Candidatus Poriferisodalis sp.]|uniref:hypothetical protein n=1 Tax=Candidatus Poriferisodalis sp. TaxID=3101277 RepID=UPI003B52C1AB
MVESTVIGTLVTEILVGVGATQPSSQGPSGGVLDETGGASRAKVATVPSATARIADKAWRHTV